MSKPLKFWQTLNQAPRSAGSNGKHRRASPKAHGRSIVGTDHSSGGSATSWVTVKSGSTWVTWESIRPKPPTVPYAGIRTGELIASRAWFVINDYQLRSLAHHFIWEPGATVTGNISEAVESDPWLWPQIMGGVYAHFTQQQTLDDILRETLLRYPIQQARFGRVAIAPLDEDAVEHATFDVDTFLGVVVGTVKLWGEVVEHERGYRAQFAKIQSLDRMFGIADLDRLRARYLLEKSASDADCPTEAK